MTPWPPYEEECVRRLYPIAGSRAVRIMLPHRTVNQITNYATRLGVRFDARWRKPKTERKQQRPAYRGSGQFEVIDEDEKARRAAEVRKTWYPEAGMIEEATR